MNILITGGSGFIGSNFILYWIKKYPKDNIINLDKLTYAGNRENLKSIETQPNYKFVRGDICDRKLVNKLMKEIDLVVHFAAESHVDRSILKPSPFIYTNIVGTQVLLDSSVINKIKHFHHISTDEVFGSLDIESPLKFNENTPYNPRSPYSASKASSDHLVRSYYYTYDLPITITNCSNNFGPYQHPEKLIPLAITNLLEGKKVPVYGDGKNIRDWLYVQDHCRAIDMVIRAGKKGETYCVGGVTRDISNLEVVRKIIKSLRKSKNQIEFIKDRLCHDRKYAINWTKIKNKLGWTPIHSFDEWLEETINWYKNNRSWWIKIRDRNFNKYYVDNYLSE